MYVSQQASKPCLNYPAWSCAIRAILQASRLVLLRVSNNLMRCATALWCRCMLTANLRSHDGACTVENCMQDCYDCHLMSCLLQAVADTTGKEDLIAALRQTLLLRVAAQLGCNKLAVGTCATRMAVRTVAMSAKGSGYALPGALQFTDSRSVEQTHLMPRHS